MYSLDKGLPNTPTSSVYRRVSVDDERGRQSARVLTESAMGQSVFRQSPK